MAVIDELRARYPHLKDYSDDELSNTIFEEVVKQRGYDRTEFDDKFLGTKESFVKDSAVSLGQGIANLGAGILATPQFVSDKFAQGIRAVLPDAILPKQREAKGFMAQAQQAGLGLKGLSDSVGKQLHTDQFNRVEENVRPKFDVDAGSLENWKNGAVWQEAKGAAGFYADNPFHAWNDLVKSAPSIAVSVGAAKLGAAGLSGSAATKAATGSVVATGAMLEGGDSGLEAMQRVQEMKPEQLKALSEPYNKLINEGATHEQAVNVIARNAGADAFAVAAAISVVASKLTGSGKLEADVATGNLNKGFVSSVGGGAVKEGAQEAVESGGSAAASNYGVYDNADKSQVIGKGVVGAAVQGSMVGTGMGSGLGLIGYATQKPQPKQAQANQPLTEKQLWGYEQKPDARPDISGSDGTDLLGGNASASQQQPDTNQTKTANQQEQSSLDAGLTQAVQNAQTMSTQNQQATAQAIQSPEVLQANASLERMMPQDPELQALAASGAPVIEISPPESKSGQSGQQEQSFDIANTLNSAIDTQNKVQIDSAYRQREAQARLKKDLDYTESQLQAFDDEYAAIKALQGKSPVTNTALHDQLTKALSEVELKRLVHAENRQRIMESGNQKLVEAGAQEMQGVATPELPVAINESLQPQEQIKLPPNYADERLSDTNYRNALGAIFSDSTEGGNISLVPKAGTGYVGGDGKIHNQEMKRTKSTNPVVTQLLVSKGYTVSEIKAALVAALEGKPLGKRYQGIVTEALYYAEEDADAIAQEITDYQARLDADITPHALGYGDSVNAPFAPDNAQPVTLADQEQPRGADGGVRFSYNNRQKEIRGVHNVTHNNKQKTLIKKADADSVVAFERGFESKKKTGRSGFGSVHIQKHLPDGSVGHVTNHEVVMIVDMLKDDNVNFNVEPDGKRKYVKNLSDGHKLTLLVGDREDGERVITLYTNRNMGSSGATTSATEGNPSAKNPHQNTTTAALTKQAATDIINQDADSGVKFSQSAMKSVDANIKRGTEAMHKVITEKTNVHRAMYRNDIGWVDFVWGDEGVVKPNGKTKGAMGLSHVIEARMRKDGMSYDDVMQLMPRLVEAVAKGSEIRSYEFKGSKNLTVGYDDVEVILIKNKGSNSWVMNGWEVYAPDAVSVGNVTTNPTLSKSTTTQLEQGADAQENTTTTTSDDATKFSFAGQKAKTANLENLATAQQALADGMGRDEVRQRTGWYQDEADKQWKWEIDDSGAVLVKDLKQHETERLHSILAHDALYEAYPSIGYVGIRISNMIGFGAAYDYSTNTIYLGEWLPRSEYKTAILHEVQHAIQKAEGFARGGNIAEFKNYRKRELAKINRQFNKLEHGSVQQRELLDYRLKVKADKRTDRELYEALAGETEARNTQTRLTMDAQARKLTAPWETQDVPSDKQIVRFDGGRAEMAVDESVIRGIDAIHKVYDSGVDIRHAMYRNGSGWVDFLHGYIGDIPDKKGNRAGAKGVSHIAEARMRKDGFTHDQAMKTLDDVVVAIAKGDGEKSKFENSKTGKKGEKEVVVYGNFTAVLIKNEGEDSWLLTGYYPKGYVPDVTGKDGGKTSATHNEAIPIANTMGAGTDKNTTTAALTKQAATDIINQDADGKRLLKNGKVMVLGSIDEAPDNVQDQITLSDDDGNIQGFFDPVTDTTYLVADALTKNTIQGVMVHEVGVHAWWAKANSDKKMALEKRAMQLMNQGKRFGNEKIKAFYAGVEQRMIDAEVQGNAEEATAYIVEEAINQAKADRSKLSDSQVIAWVAKNISQSLANFLSDFISAVRASMHRIGWLKTASLTGADLVAIAKRNMREVATSKGVENTQDNTGDYVGVLASMASDTPTQAEIAQAKRDTGAQLAIADKLEAEYGYLPAPNGEKSNLNKQQWAQVRTPQFKAWFGDWDTVNNLEWLDNAEPVARMKGDEVPRFDKVKPLADWVGEHWESSTGGQVDRADLGVISVDRKAASNSAGHGFGAVKTQAFYLVPEALKQGRLLGKLPEVKGKPEAFIIAAPIGIGEKTYRLLMEVRRDANMQRLYVHEAVLRDNVAIDGFVSAADHSDGIKPHSPHKGYIYNFMLGLREKQAQGASKVVDANGEPLVVYHGTGADFDAFSLENFGKTDGGWYGAGHYFTPQKEFANFYAGYNSNDGSNIMPVYLSLKNPLKNLKYALEAKENGHDGIIVPRDLNGGNAFNYEGQNGNYINELLVFSENQIKSAIGNVGTFSEKTGKIQFSKGGAAKQDKPTFTVPEFTLFRKAQQKFQNNFNRIKQIQDAIVKQGGKVPPTSDVYKAEELFWGKVGSSSAQFAMDVRKLIGDISKSNIDLGDMEDYLYARHAPERNAHIRNNVDANNMAGSGISDDVAQGIMANLQTKHKDIDKLADRFDAITKETRVLQYQAGLISKDAFDSWNKYSHYAPLKGFADESLEKEFANSQVGIGRGFDVRGKESKTANGRTTLATALIENIYQQRLQAIVRGGKNEIGAALLNLINDNPNNDLWQIGTIVQSKGSKDGEALLRFDTEQERDKYLDNHGIKGAQLGFDGTSHTARYTAPIGLVKNAIDQGSSTVAVKIGGKEVFIKIKDDALLEQLQRAGIVSDLGMLEPIAQMQNMLKRFYTSLNPEFTVINFMRDLLTAFVAMPKETGNFTDSVKFIKNLSVIGASMRYAYRGRDANISKDNKDLMARYLANGGSTGFMDFQDIEQLGKRVNNMWLDANKAKNAGLWDKAKMLSRMAWELTGAQIEKANEGLEIATRLAAFKTAIEAGKTDREAASIAKNITVNFNRKGDYARQADVFMMFFNPAIQGTVRVAELASNPKSATMLAGLVLLGMMTVIASGDEEDEEGNKKWDLLPDENKMKTLPMLGLAFDGNFGQIQMPYGVNFFTNIGYAMGDVYRYYQSNGKHGKSPAEATEFTLKALTLHLNPFGGKQLFEGGLNTVQAVTPAMLDPIIQIGANINWAGKPMRPEDTHNKGKNDATPDSEKFFAGQENNPETKLAQWLSRATGGDGVKSGIFEIAPSSLNAIMSATFGGIWSMGKATHTALSKAANPNEKVELRDIPIARKMIGGVNSGMYSAAYREKADEIKGIMSQYDNYLKDGNLAQAKALRNMNSRVFDGQGSKVDSFDKQLKALRKDRNSIFANKDLSDAQRKKLLTDNKKEVDLILMKAVKDLE